MLTILVIYAKMAFGLLLALLALVHAINWWNAKQPGAPGKRRLD